METILLIAIVGTLNIVCFFIGAKVGQKVSKGESIELPSANPLKAVKEHSAKKKAERKQDRTNVIMQNIERYDGTPNGQKDVPRG